MMRDVFGNGSGDKYSDELLPGVTSKSNKSAGNSAGNKNTRK